MPRQKTSLSRASPERGTRLQKVEFLIKPLWAIVPVKPLRRSKQRLKASLGALRPGLTLAMLRDVLRALQRSRILEGTLVVTLDVEVAQLAESEGAEVVKEVGSLGMNQAIAQGITAAKCAGAGAVAVVPVDIPLLTGKEFDRLVDELLGRSAAVSEPVMGIVASNDGGGTNWLYTAPDPAFRPMYGPDSYRRHLAQARALGCWPVVLRSPAVSLDIDEEADLAEFASFCRAHPEFQATGTWQFLNGPGRRDAESAASRPPASEAPTPARDAS